MTHEQKQRLARILSDLNAGSASLRVLKFDLIAAFDGGTEKWQKSKEGKEAAAVIDMVDQAFVGTENALDVIERLLK